MSTVKRLSAPLTFKDADDGSGEVIAKFSTFDLVDRSGDIVRKSAFTDGQSVPMVWSHDWTKPVGKGVIRVHRDHATFEGSFFKTAAGQEARETVREMGDLQEWSWGFRILEWKNNEEIPGIDITKAEAFEVSPVLVGANQETATLAVKSEFCPTCGRKNASHDSEPTADVEPVPDGAEDVAELINHLELERLSLEAIDLQ